MARKYLDDLGVPEDERPENWCPDDPRQEQWDIEQETYGFDQRETWALDNTIFMFLYERLMMFNEVNILDTSFHKEPFRGQTIDQQEALDKMIDACRIAITIKADDRTQKDLTEINNLFELLAIWHNRLWW